MAHTSDARVFWMIGGGVGLGLLFFMTLMAMDAILPAALTPGWIIAWYVSTTSLVALYILAIAGGVLEKWVAGPDNELGHGPL